MNEISNLWNCALETSRISEELTKSLIKKVFIIAERENIVLDESITSACCKYCFSVFNENCVFRIRKNHKKKISFMQIICHSCGKRVNSSVINKAKKNNQNPKGSENDAKLKQGKKSLLENILQKKKEQRNDPLSLTDFLIKIKKT
jgi:RNase P subunit RPR2